MFMLLLIVILIVGMVIYETHSLKSVTYEFNDSASLGLKYIYISDLHGKTQFINGELRGKINKEEPDFVVVTGDMTDKDLHLNRVIRELGNIKCPVIMVLGNHDRVADNWLLRKKERNLAMLAHEIGTYEGLHLLVNEEFTLRVKGKMVSIYGFDNSRYGNEQYNTVDSLVGDHKIILAHSPAILKAITEKQIDFNHLLVGHTHGNQINLPFLRGIKFYLPYVGLLEIGKFKYLSISKGLGTTRIPIRINCRPEMVIYKV